MNEWKAMKSDDVVNKQKLYDAVRSSMPGRWLDFGVKEQAAKKDN